MHSAIYLHPTLPLVVSPLKGRLYSDIHKSLWDCNRGAYERIGGGLPISNNYYAERGLRIDFVVVDGAKRPLSDEYAFSNVQAQHSITASFAKLSDYA